MLSLNDFAGKYIEISSTTYQKYDGRCARTNSLYDIIHPENFLVFRGIQNGKNEITFHFRNSKINFHSYGLESTINIGIEGCNWAYPITWTLEGSYDNITWNTIHSQTNNRVLAKRGVLCKFELDKTYSFQYVRFNSTKQNPTDAFFGFSRFQLYGTFTPEQCQNNGRSINLRIIRVLSNLFYSLYLRL